MSKSTKNRLRGAVQSDLIAGVTGQGKGKAGASTSQKQKQSNQELKDAWEAAEEAIKRGTFGEEGMVKRTVKPPPTLAQRRAIQQIAVESGRILDLPTGGTSYNPSAESHTALLDEAVQEEMGLLHKEKVAEGKLMQLGEVVIARKAAGEDVEEYAPGMAVGPGEDDDNDEEEGGEGGETEVLKKKVTKRKTQADRNKALRKREEQEKLRLHLQSQKLHKSVGGLSAAKLRKEAEKRDAEQRELERLAKFAKKERERMGLVGGEKVGRHRVEKGRVAVQLGEDLAESLRQVKVS